MSVVDVVSRKKVVVVVFIGAGHTELKAIRCDDSEDINNKSSVSVSLSD